MAAFPTPGGFGATLGVGGSVRRMEGMGTGKLFGAMKAPPSPPSMQHYSLGVGPSPGKPAFSAGAHQVMPHIRHTS